VISTLVIDDDFRVADIHSAYVSRVPGFRVVGTAGTAAEAYERVQSERPDLVLLDLYLPDEHGLSLLRRLRHGGDGSDIPRPDVIVITAARDVESVRTAIQLGAVHYVVKPFAFARLHDRLTAYKELRDSIDRLAEASQDDVDKLYGLLRAGGPPRVPKGQSLPTMTRVLETVRESTGELTAADIAERVGISRPTAARYLVELTKSGLVELDLHYGSAGRPAHHYRAARRGLSS
jgi:response regulator of citrate/malate metabolism